MNLFVFFNLFSFAVTAVLAAGGSAGSAGSSHPPGSGNPAEWPDYDEEYSLELVPSSKKSQDYAARLRSQIQDTYELQDLRITGLENGVRVTTPMSTLKSKFNEGTYREYPRFVYLGPSQFLEPDLAVATPTIDLNDGSRYYALMTVRRSKSNLRMMELHGYAKVSDAHRMAEKMLSNALPAEAVPEPGHTLAIDQLFQELESMHFER